MKLFLIFFTFSAFANISFELKRLESNKLVSRFISHKNVLAMNIPYSPIKKIRSKINKELKLKLIFNKTWKILGEAHITVITPPEYNSIQKYISISEINNIARINRIQSSDLQVLGIGSAKNSESETFFVLVRSRNLIKIREEVFQFIKRKNKNFTYSVFDPYWYFPHITVGFTKKDLHESDGVLKSAKKTFDPRLF